MKAWQLERPGGALGLTDLPIPRTARGRRRSPDRCVVMNHH